MFFELPKIATSATLTRYMKNTKMIYVFLGFAVVTALAYTWLTAPMDEQLVGACTAEAMVCPDGSTVGRSGSDCSFTACPEVDPTSVLEVVDAPITIGSLSVGELINSPLTLEGSAIGPWYFEATMPVEIWDWTGAVIATGFVTADGDWMTVDSVPFTGSVTFTSPYSLGDPVAQQAGSVVFKKANPSGEAAYDDELIIPILFTP